MYTEQPHKPPFIGGRNSPEDMVQPKKGSLKPPPLKFRFQHDLESLWWIALWIILYRVNHPKAVEVAGDVFTDDEIPSRDREELFISKKFAGYLMSIIPAELSSVVGSLDYIRAVLYFSYADEHFSGDSVVFEAANYAEIYQMLWDGFDTLVTRARAISFNFDDLTFRTNDANLIVAQKRLRSESKLRPQG